MIFFLLFSYFLLNHSFKIPYNKFYSKNILYCNNNLPLDLQYIFQNIFDFDNQLNDFPTIPNNENEIIDDSFDGYLKNEFYFILNNNLNYDYKYISFNDFYIWRKKKIGTLWTYNELKEIFESITDDNSCDLMNFILINKIIDENDGAF